jgi:4-amino-4-deoxy-L-arabinose transferase-like glycosyltransferase
VLHLFSLEADEKKKTSYSLLLGSAVGLAILTKGPVALIIVLLTLFVYLAFTSFRFFFSIKHFLLVTITALGISLFWFAFELYSNGFTFINEFVSYQADLFKNPVADHGQPFYYHPLVLLFGAFPVSIFALKGLVKRKLDASNPQDNFYLFMMILFWVVLILFSIVKTKIVHYSSCCYLPLTFMAAQQINDFIFRGKKISKWQILLFACIGSVLAILIGILPFTDVLKHNIIPLINDDFAVASLSVDAHWNGYEFMLGSMLLSIVFVTCYYLFRNENAKGFMLILSFIATFLPALLRLVAPKIEEYSQRPAIEFFESIAGKDCYVCTPGYRSYATYFYAKVMPQSNAKYYDENWLKTGDIDKPTYFVMHVGGSKDHVNDEMSLLYTKGGFEFYKREIQVKKP